MLSFLLFCLSASALPTIFGKGESGFSVESIGKEVVEDFVEHRARYNASLWTVFNACVVIYIGVSLFRYSRDLSKSTESDRVNQVDVDPEVQIFFENGCTMESYFAQQAAHFVTACGLTCSVSKVPNDKKLLHEGSLGDTTIILLFSCKNKPFNISIDPQPNRTIQYALFGITETIASLQEFHNLARKFKEQGFRELFSTQVVHHHEPQVNDTFYNWITSVVKVLSPEVGLKHPLPLLTQCSNFGYYNKWRLTKREWCDAVGESTHPWKENDTFSGTVVDVQTTDDIKRVTLEIDHFEDLDFQYGLLDRLRLVPKNNIENALFICLRCGLDPNMVVEFCSYLPNLTLPYLPHISVRNLLLHYLDIHQPINKYMIDLLNSKLPNEATKIQEFCNQHDRCNVIDLFRGIEDLVLPLELLAEMLRQVQNLPLRIISHDFSGGLITFIHDLHYSNQDVADHSNYIINLKENQEVQLYFEKSSVQIPHDRELDVVLVADELGAFSVLNILDKLSEMRVTCDITVLVQASQKEVTRRFAEYTLPNLTIKQGNSISDILKQNAAWLREMLTMHNSFFHINTSVDNVQSTMSVLIQALCMSTDGSSLEHLDIYSMGRVVEQITKMQKKNEFITHVF